jgi:hypothetical protein
MNDLMTRMLFGTVIAKNRGLTQSEAFKVGLLTGMDNSKNMFMPVVSAKMMADDKIALEHTQAELAAANANLAKANEDLKTASATLGNTQTAANANLANENLKTARTTLDTIKTEYDTVKNSDAITKYKDLKEELDKLDILKAGDLTKITNEIIAVLTKNLTVSTAAAIPAVAAATPTSTGKGTGTGTTQP